MEVKRRTAGTLVRRLSSESDQTRTEALCELRLISKHDPDSRRLIAEANAIPLLTRFLHSPETAFQENSMAVLFNISISHREPLMPSPALLDSLAHVLRQPASPSAAQTAAATLHSLLVVEAYRPIIGAKQNLLSPLVSLIQQPNSPGRSIKDALKALFGVALYPLNRSRLIELDLVQPLFRLVVKDSRVGVVEDATAVIAQVAGCYESVEAFRKVSGVRVLVNLLDTATDSTMRVKENAVSALLNLVQCGGEEAAADVGEMGTSGAWEGTLHVAENASAKSRAKANQLLCLLDKKHRRFAVPHQDDPPP